jgi:hypothetical protein
VFIEALLTAGDGSGLAGEYGGGASGAAGRRVGIVIENGLLASRCSLAMAMGDCCDFDRDDDMLLVLLFDLRLNFRNIFSMSLVVSVGARW